MTFVIVMGFHQIIVVMNDVKRHTYTHTYNVCMLVCSQLTSYFFLLTEIKLGELLFSV